VVDFIDLQVWPVFNLADSAIVSGAGLLAVGSFLWDRAEGSGDPARVDQAAASDEHHAAADER